MGDLDLRVLERAAETPAAADRLEAERRRRGDLRPAPLRAELLGELARGLSGAHRRRGTVDVRLEPPVESRFFHRPEAERRVRLGGILMATERDRAARTVRLLRRADALDLGMRTPFYNHVDYVADLVDLEVGPEALSFRGLLCGIDRSLMPRSAAIPRPAAEAMRASLRWVDALASALLELRRARIIAFVIRVPGEHGGAPALHRAEVWPQEGTTVAVPADIWPRPFLAPPERAALRRVDWSIAEPEERVHTWRGGRWHRTLRAEQEAARA